jgi:hypothetical protein
MRTFEWLCAARYSNTARAHESGKTHDGVAVHYYDRGQVQAQCMGVTESSGISGA